MTVDEPATYRDLRLRHTCSICREWIEPGTERIIDLRFVHDGACEEELTRRRDRL
jgi:hypothetical protein